MIESDAHQARTPDPPQRIVVLAEHDYRFGIGPLILRIQRIDRTNPMHYDGEDWVTVHGAELRRDGVDLGQRVVLVRAARLAMRVSSDLGDRR